MRCAARSSFQSPLAIGDRSFTHEGGPPAYVTTASVRPHIGPEIANSDRDRRTMKALLRQTGGAADFERRTISGRIIAAESDCRFQISDCNCRLQMADGRLQLQI